MYPIEQKPSSRTDAGTGVPSDAEVWRKEGIGDEINGKFLG